MYTYKMGEGKHVHVYQLRAGQTEHSREGRILCYILAVLSKYSGYIVKYIVLAIFPLKYGFITVYTKHLDCIVHNNNNTKVI